MPKKANIEKLVYTIQDLCRVCYTCVRECPVKAIKIINGQAQVIPERCIACGNCTKVCSQGAKVFRSTVDNVLHLLQKNKVAALVAPSFPAEFKELKSHKVIVGMLRKLGFAYVNEVSFGADLVANKYQKLLLENPNERFISSDCPAIVSFIERYHPSLISNLAPVVSPMIALTRVLKKHYSDDIKVVFIGPCIAKKDESEEIDDAITFTELRQMFIDSGIFPENATLSDFDFPHGGKGSIFPVSRGLLQTVNMKDDIETGNVVVASGRINFPDVIKSFEKGLIEARHLELLCCDGCIMGPGNSQNGKLYERKNFVGKYVQQKYKTLDWQKWNDFYVKYQSVDLSRTFKSKLQPAYVPSEKQILETYYIMGKYKEQDRLDCGACGYETCRNQAIAVINGLAEVEMCLPYTIDKLHDSVNELALSNEKLITMRQTLKQTEKLAHMGQLSAGIAHELNNPLGVIIMYANILLEECKTDSELNKDLKLIVQQSERCKNIVGGLLNFARKNQVNHVDADVNVLMKQSVSSVIIPDNIILKVHSLVTSPKAQLDTEQMIQVLSNLIKNGIEAMPEGGNMDIYLQDNEDEIIFIIKDTGTGISPGDREKVFEPFFTTKGIGKGTGLGLATAYGVVKMHKGQITVSSNTDTALGDTGTEFKIVLPRNRE